jgi:hypothetical protein
MNEHTLLYRQIYPSWLRDGIPTSQSFNPTPKDNLLLSVTDGDQIDAAAAFHDFTVRQKLSSAGVLAVTVGACQTAGVSARPDPLPDHAAHAVIDFSNTPSTGARRRVAKDLTEVALQRGWAYIA